MNRISKVVLFLGVLAVSGSVRAQTGTSWDPAKSAEIQNEARQAIDSIEGRKGEFTKSFKAYAGKWVIPNMEFYLPHQWKPGTLPSGARKAITEHIWKFDAMMTAGAFNPFQAKRFAGCFDPRVIPDYPVPEAGGVGLCIPSPTVIFRIPLYVCFDPMFSAGNCCPSWTPMLKKCGIPTWKGDATKYFDTYGYKLHFWWPENEVEIENYGVSAFYPFFECRNGKNADPEEFNFGYTYLTNFLRKYKAVTSAKAGDGTEVKIDHALSSNPLDPAFVNPLLRTWPHIGNSQWAGMLPGDQTFQAEAHSWRTFLHTLALINKKDEDGYTGYRRSCRCFYGTLGEESEGDAWDHGSDQVVNGWTELAPIFPFWRSYQRSKDLECQSGSFYYDAIKDFKNIQEDTCASWRAANVAGAGDLTEFLGKSDAQRQLAVHACGSRFHKNPKICSELERICYKGDGQLFPIVGQLMGNYSPLPASAFLARRALYLFGKQKASSGGGCDDFMPDNRRIHRYSESKDKMQRIYPVDGVTPITLQSSNCFRPAEIPNTLDETSTGSEWPRDLQGPYASIGAPVAPPPPGVPEIYPPKADPESMAELPFRVGGHVAVAGPLSNVRFNHWNYREACMCPHKGPVWGLALKGGSKWKVINCSQYRNACRLRYEDDASRGDENDQEATKGGGTEGDGGLPALAIFFGIVAQHVPYPFVPLGLGGSDKAWFDKLRTDPNSSGVQCELQYSNNRNVKYANPVDPAWREDKGGVQCKKDEAEGGGDGSGATSLPSGAQGQYNSDLNTGTNSGDQSWKGDFGNQQMPSDIANDISHQKP